MEKQEVLTICRKNPVGVKCCIMVRDFPNSTDQPDEIALTIYLTGVPSANRAEKAWKRGILSNGKEFSAVSFPWKKEEYLWRYSTISERNFRIFWTNGKHPRICGVKNHGRLEFGNFKMDQFEKLVRLSTGTLEHLGLTCIVLWSREPREPRLHEHARRALILVAQSNVFVTWLTKAVPIQCHPISLYKVLHQ